MPIPITTQTSHKKSSFFFDVKTLEIYEFLFNSLISGHFHRIVRINWKGVSPISSIK